MKIQSITREELEKIYQENSTSTAAKKLGISIPCLYSYLKERNISLKGRGSKKGSKKRKKLWIIG